MLNLFSTLVKGVNARAVENTTDHFAIDLISQKIHEAEQGLSQAKNTLATLIIRQRQEAKLLAQLIARKNDLENRAKKALADDNEALAIDAATAIAELENEQTVRKETLERLGERVDRMRFS
ncbi:MAG: PspA/IM30 family protein, partial [Rhizobiaceae bacterium]|nr:PspA/IM30 family protein [Rhizobiaceae bacterium]